jgi:signal transduction histidine kinase/ActR/RegA family two-component response regulator
MPAFRDLPIRRKLTSANIATTGLALLLASAAFAAYEAYSFRARLVRQMSTQADIVGYNAASAILFEDHEAAARTLAALVAEPHVLAAGVYLPGGEEFATYRRKGVEGRVLHEGGAVDGHRFESGGLLVQRGIVVDGERIGSVRVLTDLDELAASGTRFGVIAVVVFIASIIASLPLLARLQRVILEPIIDLVRKARIVSEQKDYSVRAVPASEDELGLLVHTFNEMLAQIQKRDQDLERARDEAETANRAKDEFLAVLSHELRTPLSPVLAWARMLRSGQLDAERTNRGLDVIERNVKSQVQLIEDLLDVSRIITGKMRLDVRPTEVGPVVEAAVDSVRSTADVKGIRLQTILDPRAVLVAGDPERLKQIFWNLLSNAIKFTPKGGRVQIVVQRINSHVEIAVSDTGKGIDAAFLPYVFDRFRQADSTSTRAHGGLGVGLSIVRHLVELHAGSVRAESPGEGKGATFTVELPIAVVHAAPAADRVHPNDDDAAPPALPVAMLAGLDILVVDDDADTLDTVRVLLEQSGARVRVAGSVREALETMSSRVPDLLISDIGMPDEDGYALIRKVRALDPEHGGRVPALALTAYARVEDRLQVLSAGFQMHVPKPIEPAELIAVVGSLAEWMPKDGRRRA